MLNVNINVTTAPDKPRASEASTFQVSRLEQPSILLVMPLSSLLTLAMPCTQPPLLPPLGAYRPEPVPLLNRPQPLPFLQGLFEPANKLHPHGQSPARPGESEQQILSRQLGDMTKVFQKGMEALSEAAKGLKF